MTTLTRDEIVKRLELREKDQLVVTPLLFPTKQIGRVSIDVRLGNQFLVFRSHSLGVYAVPGAASANLRRMQERVVVQPKDQFVLHPGMLVLGSTLEYLRLPSDLECQVEGRSSWARLGLVIATATLVEPGFRGVVTLEMSNVGTIPLVLRPGTRIAQLVFRTVIESKMGGEPFDASRKYRCPIGPEFSRAHEDWDLEM